MSLTFRRNGIYRHRFMWWYPWSVTDWWKPRAFRGGDEWCNDSIGLIIPPFGAAVLFWRPGKLRAMPCSEEWGAMDGEQRADYAPCGYYHGGRIRKGGHLHWETGICEEARTWLRLAAPPVPSSHGASGNMGG